MPPRRGLRRGRAPVPDPDPPGSPTPSEATSVESSSDDDQDELSGPVFSPEGRSDIARSTPETPTRGAASRGISSLAGLRRTLLGSGKKTAKTRPLRPEAYLRHAAWCMHCFRTFLDNWDTSEPPVIPCWDDGLASKKCRQCASRNKNCEPVSFIDGHGVSTVTDWRFAVGERGNPRRRDAFTMHSGLGQDFLGDRR